ncbi:hypothetical protein HYV58_01100 [Candidatus Peregrinibacteria bacterium]|nr:hypothetical protein [Candidatus Peregrinibacteria bacterium]
MTSAIIAGMNVRCPGRSLILTIFLIGILGFSHTAEAYTAGILPKAPSECKTAVPPGNEAEVVKATRNQIAFEKALRGKTGRDHRNMVYNILGCAIKLGRVHLFMLPFFITFLIQFLLSIAGLIAVLFVVLGGYWYVVSGLVEDKEKGKNYILHALMGLIVALSAWIVVNFIQVALTS